MKILGKLQELVEVVFRKNTYNITIKPNTSVTYTDDREIQLPPENASGILMSATSPATMTNKTFDLAAGNNNTLSNITNTHIALSAGIEDTKLATISTPGKVSNSATTAVSINAPNAIVTRDSSGNFWASRITANLSGNVTGTASNVTEIVQPSNGGTGVNNGGTLTYGNNNITFNTLGITSLNLPQSGLLVSDIADVTLLNKQISSTNSLTGALRLPSGDFTNRPSPASTGMIRYNTVMSWAEIFNGTMWENVATGDIVTPTSNQTLLNKFISSTDSTTGALQLPSGDFTNRPSPIAGMIRYNTAISSAEIYDGIGWAPVGSGSGGGESPAVVEQVIVESVNYYSDYTTASTFGYNAVGPNINLNANNTYEISISGVSNIIPTTFPITNVDPENTLQTEIDFKDISTNLSIKNSILATSIIRRKQFGDHITLSSEVGFNYKFRITPASNITIKLYSNCYASFNFNTNPSTHALYRVRIGLTNFGPAPAI